MNSAKFASITPDLVVRKGEARPWPQAEPRAPRMIAVPQAEDTEDVLAEDVPVTPELASHAKRCSLRMTTCEYQRLGIIAVKRNLSRQQVLRQAFEEYLAAVELEYGAACGCLSGGGCRNEAKPNGAIAEWWPHRS